MILISCHNSITPDDSFVPDPKMIIDDHVIWNNQTKPALIDRDVHITSNGTLEISPGTTIEFLSGSVVVWDPCGNLTRNPSLIIDGRMICQGKPDSIITIKGTDSESHGSIHIYVAKQNPDNPDFVLEYAELSVIYVRNESPTISHCDIGYLSIHSCIDAIVDSNDIVSISINSSDGVVSHNRINGHIELRDDTMIVEHNVITGGMSLFNSAIGSSGSSRAIIQNNCIRDTEVGLSIFSGSPTIINNDYINNITNILIIPFYDSVENDTIIATYNWWGTDDKPNINSMITYQSNGGQYSDKVVTFVPYNVDAFGNCD